VSAVVNIAVVWLHPQLIAKRTGKILAFLALFILPVLVTTLGVSVHLEHSKSTEFCLSCHVMVPYGKSLQIDDGDYLPASHFQNNRIPKDRACYTCHTNYTMFGDMRSKLRGLRHVYVYYIGTVPEAIELYDPYDNRECLHCHAGARSFEESDLHLEFRTEFEANETSCLECHALTHNIEELEQIEPWNPEEQ
jgi:cytochrome c-type protein NapC